MTAAANGAVIADCRGKLRYCLPCGVVGIFDDPSDGSETASGPHELTALRLRLRSNGYHPVPVVGAHIPTDSAGKRPTMTAWETECAAGRAANGGPRGK